MADYPQESIDAIIQWSVENLTSEGYGADGDKRLDFDMIDEHLADILIEIRFATAERMGVKIT